MNQKFEQIAERFNLDLDHNGEYYTNHKTGMCHFFFTAHDIEIELLKHDLANEKCATKLLTNLCDSLEEKIRKAGIK